MSLGKLACPEHQRKTRLSTGLELVLKFKQITPLCFSFLISNMGKGILTPQTKLSDGTLAGMPGAKASLCATHQHTVPTTPTNVSSSYAPKKGIK